MESPLSFSGKFFPKRAKNDVFFHKIRLEMGQKGHIMVPKGLKMHEKRQKIEFLDLKNLLFSGIFLSRIGGYPPPPLTENCRKFSLKNGSKRAKIGVFWPKIAVF